MTKLSSKRQWQLKHWYKEYSDLPVDIIKQIIDYKSSRHHSVHDKIESIKKLNERIKVYENALGKHIAYRGSVIRYPDVYFDDGVYIDEGGYSYRIPVSDFKIEIQWLKNQRRKLVASCKYDQMKRSF